MDLHGPVSDFIVSGLSQFPIFRDYRDGKITHAEYVAGLEAQAEEIEPAVGGAWHMRFIASRYPADFDRNADAVFAELRGRDLVGEMPETKPFEDFRAEIIAKFSHDAYRTYINPDEARLLYLVSMACRPRRMVVIGSYYAFWAIWAMPGVVEADGQAILIDPDAAVCDLARRNLDALGFGDRADIRAEKAEDVLPEIEPESLDVVVLDAAGSSDHPDPGYHGKGIYTFMAPAILEKLRPGGLLVVHNDYLPDVGANRLAQPILDGNAAQLEPFHAFCDQHFPTHHIGATPDGFGVYQK